MAYGYGWKPYVPVAARRAKSQRAAARARKNGAAYTPVEPFRGAIAKTFWGKAWCDNLEHYSDYANRLPRGRSYVRSGSVIDLRIAEGSVHAQVMGSRLYRVEVTVKPVAAARWKRLAAGCAGSIDSLVELLQGKLSEAVMKRICQPGAGLFPVPREIRFTCSCPDWAGMCKHVAAVLYGVGNRLDRDPALLFTLRGVDAAELIASAGTELDTTAPGVSASIRLESDAMAELFGIELIDAPAPVPKKRAPLGKPRKAGSGAKRTTAVSGKRKPAR